MMRHLQGAFKTLQSMVTVPPKPAPVKGSQHKLDEKKIMKEISLNKAIPVRRPTKARTVKKKVPETPTQTEKRKLLEIQYDIFP